MKIYQVGGCVRDSLLGYQPHDFDYLVVGGSIEEMLSLGYKQVGRGFPVFLHPKTREEYALARKELKKGDKHTDFDFIFTPDITLAEDMQRRDFTINALAQDMETGKIVDTVGGVEDLKRKIIRHVNDEHFGEDPLRVLRMCRFAAKLNFEVAPETMQLAKNMVNSGMLLHLTPERVWKEVEKALDTDHFEKFIRIARECGALKAILPEVDELWNVPEKKQYHPEGNSGEHTMLAIRSGEYLSASIKFALLLHDIGKICTPKNILPAHYAHDVRGILVIDRICKRLQIPNRYKKMAILGCKNHMKFMLLQQMKIGKKFDFVGSISADFKDEKLMNDIIEICRCDMMGCAKELNEESLKYFNNTAMICRKIFEKASIIKATDIPNFDKLPKEQKFAAVYRDYRIKRVFEK